jgi:NAD(P)-dependent dehydrogenase (short-subunit alcohol dehydrogenase family)
MVTGTHPLASGLAQGLVARGDAVVTVAPEASPTVAADGVTNDFVPCSFDSEAEVGRAVAEATARLGGLDEVVHTWLAPALLSERAFVDIGPEEWITACEGSLEGAWWLARAIRSPLQGSGSGAAVFVVPSISMAGAAGYAMLATVAEGIRVLAKGCGRQWAKDAVTVNIVATAPHHWVSTTAGEALSKAFSLSTPAFGGPGEIADDLAPLVSLLASRDAHFLTAATLVADGGLWMGL